MKRFFIYAVAITALCTSCETENELLIKENNTKTKTSPVAKDSKVNDYQIYTDIINNFTYDHLKTYEENIVLFEQYVNQEIPNYIPLENHGYEKIKREQLLALQQADKTFVTQLVYTQETKQVIYDILENRYNTNNTQLITDENEQNLIQTLVALYGNGDDNKWNGKKSIAFAYGAQYNITQAILYAGAIELLAR